METKSIFIALIFASLAILPGAATAAEFYRPNPHARYMGMNQGNFGSCQAEADVMSLESAFAARGLPARLSTFYRHAFNWADNKVADARDAGLVYNDADRQLIAQMGPLLPDYMWPETAEGLNPAEQGNNAVRPHVSEAALIDTRFPNARSMGYRVIDLPFNLTGAGGVAATFQFSGSTSVTVRNTLERIKFEVASNKAVSIAMHGSLMWSLNWNHTTGLLQSKYTIAHMNRAIEESVKKSEPPINHALAVVGFDDSLYSDHGYNLPGALIIRNSWNDNHKISLASQRPFTAEDEAGLEKMRYKLSRSQPLPGYYAIPYQYIVDLMTREIGYARLIELNYLAFTEAYMRMRGDYKTHALPFVCDRSKSYPNGKLSAKAQTTVLNIANAIQEASDPNVDALQRRKRRTEVDQFMMLQTARRNGNSQATFSYALVPSNRSLGKDRVAEFYQGRLSTFYCGLPEPLRMDGHDVYPAAQLIEIPTMGLALETVQSSIRSKSAWERFIVSLAEIQELHYYLRNELDILEKEKP